MELIYYNDQTTDSGYLTHYEGDFEISSDYENGNNDFEVVTRIPDDGKILYSEDPNAGAYMLFVPGTEWGGYITGATIDVGENTVTYKGKTWRGYLADTIIEPGPGEDYYTTSGMLWDVLLEVPWHPIISVGYVEDEDIEVSSFTYNRYVTAIDGVTALLNSINQNLRIYLSTDEMEEGYTVTLTAEWVKNISDSVQFSQDYGDKIPLKITYAEDIPHRLICLGQGELAQREVINYYFTNDWEITTTYDEWDEEINIYPYPVEVYDASNSSDLANDGKKKMLEFLANRKQIEVDLSEVSDVGINTIVSAKDQITGETVAAEVTGIIWRVSNYGERQEESFEYKTKVKTVLEESQK